ncbi:MAG: hypothetical protein ACI4I1_10650 [Oscillospiraceae bacterium]
MENNGNDFFDPIENGSGADNGGGYVPRFERDLQKMGGNLGALADAKKAERQAEEKNQPAEEQSPNENVSEIAEYTDIYDQSNDADEYEEDEKEKISYSPYYSAPIKEDSYEDDGYRRGKTVEELIHENEEQDLIEEAKAKQRAAEEAYHNLEDIKVSADMISDMGYNYKQQERKDKLKQQELDDLAKEIGSRPKVEEMSTEYLPSAPLKKQSTFSSQDALDRDEKQLIKERLQKEIDSRPKGINKKNSAELYKSLMHEQKVKRAKKGMLSLVVMMAGGIIAAAIIHSKLNPDNLNILTYISMGGVIFSILMMLKAKFFRTLSCLFFSGETVFMVYTCVTFALNTERKPDNYFDTLICFIIVIAVCAIIAIQLATNANIESYYTTSFSKKQAAQSAPAKSGSRRTGTAQRKK